MGSGRRPRAPLRVLQEFFCIREGYKGHGILWERGRRRLMFALFSKLVV